MLEVIYQEDAEIPRHLVRHINDHLGDYMSASIPNHPAYNDTEILIRQRPRKDIPYGYTYGMSFEKGLLSLWDHDVLFSESPFFTFEDLARYDEDEILYHYEDVPEIKEDLTRLMTLFKETRLIWIPSLEYLEDAEKEGEPVYGHSYADASVEPDLFICYGFGGDPYWQEALDRLLMPCLPEGMALRYAQDNPLCLELYLPNTSTVLTLKHPYHVEGEFSPSIVWQSRSCTNSEHARTMLSKDRLLIEFLSLIERHIEPEIRTFYRQSVRGE